MPRGRKDDPKPKGRMSAYAFFIQTCRKEYKEEHPHENVAFIEFSKECARKWRAMDDKDKKRFYDMAAKDKRRYDAEMKNYIPPEGAKKRNKRKRVKDANAPKRPFSIFFCFCNDERTKVKREHPEYGIIDIAKKLGRRWADVDPKIKLKYKAIAEQDRARYENEMIVYKNKLRLIVAPVSESEEEQDSDEENDSEEGETEDDEDE